MDPRREVDPCRSCVEQFLRISDRRFLGLAVSRALVVVDTASLGFWAITTPSKTGQVDLHRGAGRPRWKSLPWQQPHSAAAYQVIGEVPGQFETEHEVHQTNCEIGENATFQVLVKQLSGSTLGGLGAW